MGIFGDPRSPSPNPGDGDGDWGWVTFGKNPRGWGFSGIGMDFPGMGWGSPKIPGYDFFREKIENPKKNELSRIVKNVWNPQISWQLAQHFYWFQQRLLFNIIGLVFTVGEKKTVSELCNWVYIISYLRKFFYSFCKEIAKMEIAKFSHRRAKRRKAVKYMPWFAITGGGYKVQKGSRYKVQKGFFYKVHWVKIAKFWTNVPFCTL